MEGEERKEAGSEGDGKGEAGGGQGDGQPSCKALSLTASQAGAWGVRRVLPTCLLCHCLLTTSPGGGWGPEHLCFRDETPSVGEVPWCPPLSSKVMCLVSDKSWFRIHSSFRWPAHQSLSTLVNNFKVLSEAKLEYIVYHILLSPIFSFST